MKTGQQLLTQFFVFDFAVSGGAVGIYKTGIQVPAGAIFIPFIGDYKTNTYQLTYFCLTTITGGPDINLGTTLLPSLLFSVAAASTVAGTWETNGNPAPVTTIMDSTLDITLEIHGNPMTAGKINGYVQYFLPA